MNNWNNVVLEPVFNEQGVICYRLEGENYVNEYYVTSEAETRKLLNTPEIVGYEVYNCLIPSTSQMLYYLKEQKKVTTANILSILRGALNYPLEESCYREHIRVHDISFLSSERVFVEEEIAGLETIQQAHDGAGQHAADWRYHRQRRDADPLPPLCDGLLQKSWREASQYYHFYDRRH